MKHQGQCGSCLTFSTTKCFESVWSTASGNLLTLSEQQLVDCITVDSACNGELTNNGFAFAAKNARGGPALHWPGHAPLHLPVSA